MFLNESRVRYLNIEHNHTVINVENANGTIYNDLMIGGKIKKLILKMEIIT